MDGSPNSSVSLHPSLGRSGVWNPLGTSRSPSDVVAKWVEQDRSSDWIRDPRTVHSDRLVAVELRSLELLDLGCLDRRTAGGLEALPFPSERSAVNGAVDGETFRSRLLVRYVWLLFICVVSSIDEPLGTGGPVE